MTRRERLMATLRGEPVDRPPVNFYEIGGFDINPADPDEFNIYNAPSWQPLLQLAEEETDLIRMRGPARKAVAPDLSPRFFQNETFMQDGSRYTRTTLRVAGREMTSLSRRDPAVNTHWTVEHLLKNTDDLRAYLELPDELFHAETDVTPLVRADQEIGDRGIVMVDTGDPICWAASLFSMEEYTVIALTEPALFHRLLEKLARVIYPQTEAAARDFAGHLWRICGPEYATEPYLPPHLFDEYVVRYTGPMVATIQKYGGFARLHCHGRLRGALPLIASMHPNGLDPIEPPPQGDMPLAEVRRRYGREMVLFGNIESSDLESLEPPQFEKQVRRALEEGTAGEGRGFVLMPSACPYGRTIAPNTLANYETMVRLATTWRRE